MSTHILSTAEKFCDKFIVLHEGQVIADGDLAALRAKFNLPEASLDEIYVALTDESWQHMAKIFLVCLPSDVPTGAPKISNTSAMCSMITCPRPHVLIGFLAYQYADFLKNYRNIGGQAMSLLS